MSLKKVKYLDNVLEVEKERKVNLEGKEYVLLYLKNGLIINKEAVDYEEEKNNESKA